MIFLNFILLFNVHDVRWVDKTLDQTLYKHNIKLYGFKVTSI